MMEEYNGYWVSGSAVPGPPNTTYWTMRATVLKQRPNGSVFEVVRAQIDDWTIEFKELAEWFALEISRMIVDHGLNP